MKKSVTKGLRLLFFILLTVCLFSFPAFSADVEGSYGTTDTGIYGWAWHKGHPDKALTVKLLFYYEDSSKYKKALSLTADKYNKNVETEIGNGKHYFEAVVDWSSLGGKPKQIQAYAVYDDIWFPIGTTAAGGSSKSGSAATSGSSKKQGNASSSKDSSSSGGSGSSSSSKGSSSSGSSSSSGGSSNSSSSSSQIPPKPEGSVFSEAPEKSNTSLSSGAPSGKTSSFNQGGPGVPSPVEDSGPKRGKSLGTFSVTGYCTCPECIIGQGLTYSGKKPEPNHTIAADLKLYPIGTKLIIDDVIYTVEDTGSAMVGNKLDIYFGTHEGAITFGRQNKEVFEVIE
ncbi:3D domain-containing protein [Lachnospiraceae bacterium 62-35]